MEKIKESLSDIFFLILAGEVLGIGLFTTYAIMEWWVILSP